MIQPHSTLRALQLFWRPSINCMFMYIFLFLLVLAMRSGYLLIYQSRSCINSGSNYLHAKASICLYIQVNLLINLVSF